MPASAVTPASAPAPAAPCPPALDFKATQLLGERPASLCAYAGKVVLIVNTASQCGYTPQYEGLEQLHRRFAAKGLVVLGFPANDFGAQEKGSNAEIAQFCRINYGVSFPMFQKLEQPIAAEPLFAALARLTNEKPRWNFHKYLIGRDGSVTSFGSSVEPTGTVLVKAIEGELARRSKP